jgi:5-methylcytosine-specific restriction endonuclease McrA
MKQYYQENRGRILEYGKQRHQKYREQNLKYKRQWRRENPDYDRHWHQDNREQRLDYMKQWRQENLEKVAASSARRRVLKLENTSDVISNCTEEKGRVEKIYKLRQLFTKATGVEYHVDHIWPLSKGGPHWSGNLQIITAEENLSKGDSMCEETARVIQESLDEYYCTRQRE